jgi:hypothetical protein
MRMNKIRYSKDVPGETGNYLWPVKFDEARGFVGISQRHNEEGGVIDRVLLSPKQVRALLTFVSKKK